MYCFSKPGKENTKRTIELAIEAAKQREINHIVVASGTGETAELLIGKGLNVTCVTLVNGYKEKGKPALDIEVKEKLNAAGIKVLTTTHVLSGSERGISKQAGGMYPVEIMAHTLRFFGQGTKVAVEVAIMALDAGLVPFGEKIISIGGSGGGADTAIVLTPASASEILGTKIHEIICKPEL